MGMGKKKAAPAPARAPPQPPPPGQSRFQNNTAARQANATPSQAGAPATYQAGAPPMQPASQGMGMMGTMATSMAGSMAGSMMGNAMSGMMSGSSTAPAEQPPQAPQAPQVPQAWTQAPQYGAAHAVDPCQLQHKEFMMYMSSTGDNLDQCRHLFDAYKSCNNMNPIQQ